MYEHLYYVSWFEMKYAVWLSGRIRELSSLVERSLSKCKSFAHLLDIFFAEGSLGQRSTRYSSLQHSDREGEQTCAYLLAYVNGFFRPFSLSFRLPPTINNRRSNNSPWWSTL